MLCLQIGQGKNTWLQRRLRKSNLQNEPKSAISESPSNSSRIYRLWPGNDRWGCMDCDTRGDRFDLEDHICRKNKKMGID